MFTFTLRFDPARVVSLNCCCFKVTLTGKCLRNLPLTERRAGSLPRFNSVFSLAAEAPLLHDAVVTAPQCCQGGEVQQCALSTFVVYKHHFLVWCSRGNTKAAEVESVSCLSVSLSSSLPSVCLLSPFLPPPSPPPFFLMHHHLPL